MADHLSIATLTQAVVLLAALALAAPLAKRFGTGAVLAYLLAGVVIGPYGIGLFYSVYQVQSVLGIAEYGVVMLLFLIGLELRPKRLVAMRTAVFGYGAAQVLMTAALLTFVARSMGFGLPQAAFVGLALSLSSTALTLQVLEEKGELVSQHGRLSFSILLFQDLASIPLIALVPLFGVAGAASAEGELSWWFALKALAAILVVVVGGRYVLRWLYRLAAASGVKEAMPATALLAVVSVALIMQLAGLSAALGAFIAGAMLADTEFRHDVESNIAPFEGLLLGIFFTAIGMSLNLSLLIERPLAILALTASVLAIKGAVLYGIGRVYGLGNTGARRLALSTSQAGEFAFVLLAASVGAKVMGQGPADLLAVVVTLSMIATPLLMNAPLAARKEATALAEFDVPPERRGHVLIAGLGRFGQVVARILTARGIPFIALDKSIEQVDFVRRFGSDVYYGDATRLQMLEAARAREASAIVIAIDEVDASLAVAELMKRHFPHVPIYARARNRQHVHRLMDLGVKATRREMFLASVDLTRLLLVGIGMSEREAKRLTETFKEHDRKRLYDDYEVATDDAKLREKALAAAKELEELFASDPTELGAPRAATATKPAAAAVPERS
jgi:glutathione-regulated potassium-efflux system protein KefB